MSIPRHHRVIIYTLLSFALLFCLALGVGLGLALGSSANYLRFENPLAVDFNEPSRILDRNGQVIAELVSIEDRENIAVLDVPSHLIYALLSREDRNFYRHPGFDVLRFTRAALDILMGGYSGGASTISQQVSKFLYTDWANTYKRKLVELWYSFQLERKLTKNQILELYINLVSLGHGTNGVEKASQFYFSHSAREITLAESAILVIMLSSPSKNTPIKYPERAKTKQQDVLNNMVMLGYVTRAQAEQSFQEYWRTFNHARSNTTTAFFENTSLAPYFTEYVRLLLEEDFTLSSGRNLYEDGYDIYTTLDLDVQEEMDAAFKRGINRVNANYRKSKDVSFANEEFSPIVDLLALTLNMETLHLVGQKEKEAAEEYFYTTLNPIVELLSLTSNHRDLNTTIAIAHDKELKAAEKQVAEGGMICLDNNTGGILAMIGGSDFTTKPFNRATQATRNPGSSFKPLFYSAGISERLITPGTIINDQPAVFEYDDGREPYVPSNYMADWEGKVTVAYALANSLNIPAIKVLDKVGFDKAIDRASRMLGKYDQRLDPDVFPHSYTLGLGIISVAPLDMARAFLTFPSQGREMEPYAIAYIKDRDGNIVYEPEKELFEQREKNENIQIMTPQEAYVMTEMLEGTVQYGTLAVRRRTVGGFGDMALAGKTGTTQNWMDAWTVGFSPYITTALWYGFDQPGQSLTQSNSGGRAAGQTFAEFMRDIHPRMGWEDRQFDRPSTGLIDAEVCLESGQIPTDLCDDGTATYTFLAGTTPREFCEYHRWEQENSDTMIRRLTDELFLEKTRTEVTLPDFQINSDLDSTDNSNPLFDDNFNTGSTTDFSSDLPELPFGPSTDSETPAGFPGFDDTDSFDSNNNFDRTDTSGGVEGSEYEESAIENALPDFSESTEPGGNPSDTVSLPAFDSDAGTVNAIAEEGDQENLSENPLLND